MSQSKLEKVLPLIQSAAKIFIDEDSISESEEYETKAFCQPFTVKAIMSSGFNIGGWCFWINCGEIQGLL